MKQFFGRSQRGNLAEAARGLSNPEFIMLISNTNQFEQHVAELEKLFPKVPSIGCIGMGYDTRVTEEGVSIIAHTDGVEAVTNVLEQVSVMPVKYIQRIEQDMHKIKASGDNTICIDFCSGNDACVLTTAYSMLKKKNISLVGGTGDAGKVSANGKVYNDAAAYALVKNKNGRVRAYKENIYRPMNMNKLIASETDRSNYLVGKLNGRPAKQVYQEDLNIQESDITEQTFKNPLGKLSGKDVCIVSIKAVEGGALTCYRQVNDSDVLILLELQDYRRVVEGTIQKIHQDFQRISAVFSVNCLFRYLLFSQDNEMNNYLDAMGRLGSHAGLVGYGEHYNSQFVNQSMTCVVFE